MIHKTTRIALIAALMLVMGCTALSPLMGSEAPSSSTSTGPQAPSAEALCDTPTAADFRAGLIAPAQDALDDLPDASIYDITIEIADDLRSLAGHETVCYTNQENVPLDEITFRLFPNLLGGRARISALQVKGKAVQPRYEMANSLLRVPLAAPLAPGDALAVAMDFDVTIPQEPDSSYGLFGAFDGVLTLHEATPVIPVYDDEGWNVEIPPRQGDITYYDASFYRVRVTAPDDLIVVASGIETAREAADDQQVLTFEAGPARGFYLAASATYSVHSDQVGATQVNSYAPAAQSAGAERALAVAIGALESFNARFGPYPYTELDVVSTPMKALGMEYPGIVAINGQLYDPQGKISGIPAPTMMEGTIAHEVAHQWFYNVVGNDQLDEPWLDEAVVQYATGLYYRDAYGARGYQGWRDSWIDRWERVDQDEIPIGLPVRAYEDDEYGAIVYGRGPLFIEALAETMGEATFEAFLRDYYETHTWGIGAEQTFRALAEEHCACDLSSLFETWVIPDPNGDETEGDTASPETSAADTEAVQGWAILAEKDEYDDVGMTNLPVEYAGLQKVRGALEGAGWPADHIRDLKEFDREALQEGLDWLEDSAGPGDVVFVYVAAHGRYLKDVLAWNAFFADEWAEIASQRRVLLVDACQAANYTDALAPDPAPYLAIAAVDGDEYAWSGVEEEGLPIIGGVFTHYFVAALDDPTADADANGLISVQEAALQAEAQQRDYMHKVVFAVPEFVEMYRQIGVAPNEDPTFPDVIIDDALGAPLYLTLDAYR